jgi:hypothetical protein
MRFDMNKKVRSSPTQFPKSADLVPAKLLPFVAALDADRTVRPPTESRVVPFITKKTYELRKWTLGWCAYRQRLRDAELRQEAERLATRDDDESNGPNEGDQ